MAEKIVEYYVALPYPIELVIDEDGGWFGRIPLLIGCEARGSTRIEALKNLEMAKVRWFQDALEKGIEIPKPGRYCES